MCRGSPSPRRMSTRFSAQASRPEPPGPDARVPLTGHALVSVAGRVSPPAYPRSGRNVGQPDHILANAIARHEAERWPGTGEIGRAATEHDRDAGRYGTRRSEPRSAEALAPGADRPPRSPLRVRPSTCTDRAPRGHRPREACSVGPDSLQRAATTTHFGCFRHAAAKACVYPPPFGMFVVPVTHDLVYAATVETARLPAASSMKWRKSVGLGANSV
jgi:hypothetical protein